jgi:hypothetical protein
MTGLTRIIVIGGLVLEAGIALAIPPLVIGDVPTAERGGIELYVGTRYQKDGAIGRQVPFTEIVLGVSTWQEITFEIPYLSQGGQQGFGDAVLGTKLLVLRETADRPGLAGSFEWKLTTGSPSRGLGTGFMEYDLRLRSQKSWSWFTLLANVGYTFVNEPRKDGVILDRRNVGFAAVGQDVEPVDGLHLLSEVYWRSSDTPGEPARVSADIGFKYAFFRHLSVHAAAGTSLRRESLGGPQLRVYDGLKWDFVAF